MNNDLRAVLQQIVNLSTDDKIGLALNAIKGLVPELTSRFTTEQTAAIIASVFSTSAAADGKLTPEEFALIKAFLSGTNNEISDEDVLKLIAGTSTKEAYAAVLGLSKALSVDGQAKLFTLVAVICSIDNRIDPNEISYLSDIYGA